MFRRFNSSNTSDEYGLWLVKRLAPIYVKDSVLYLTQPMTAEHVVTKSTLRRLQLPPKAFNDLHNIYAVPKALNNKRSNYRFTTLISVDDNECLKTIANENYVDHRHKTFCVSEEFSGVVARCALYMRDKWGCPVDYTIKGGDTTAFTWHESHPPTQSEILHNYIIWKLTNITNPYITRTPSVL
jgi:endonuclease I